MHCLRVAKSSVLLVDSDEACRQRIQALRANIENEIDMKIEIWDQNLKGKIHNLANVKPPENLIHQVHGGFPATVIFTR